MKKLDVGAGGKREKGKSTREYECQTTEMPNKPAAKNVAVGDRESDPSKFDDRAEDLQELPKGKINPEVGLKEWHSANAQNAANVRHSQPGGYRENHAKIIEAWKCGDHGTKAACARGDISSDSTHSMSLATWFGLVWTGLEWFG